MDLVLSTGKPGACRVTTRPGPRRLVVAARARSRDRRDLRGHHAPAPDTRRACGRLTRSSATSPGDRGRPSRSKWGRSRGLCVSGLRRVGCGHDQPRPNRERLGVLACPDTGTRRERRRRVDDRDRRRWHDPARGRPRRARDPRSASPGPERPGPGTAPGVRRRPLDRSNSTSPGVRWGLRCPRRSSTRPTPRPTWRSRRRRRGRGLSRGALLGIVLVAIVATVVTVAGLLEEVLRSLFV